MKFLMAFLLVSIFRIELIAQDGQTPTLQWRPVYHFTPKKNWTNDPNGLIYIGGLFHLYNQQNPLENKWGHMSWGHATSTDLVHWKHLPVAMPEAIDKDTTWRFSGCAVLDKKNTSGFCNSPNCIVAVYTADQPNLKKESQFIAYSNDGGSTFTQYEGNPVIDLHKKDFRDPNVFWHEASKKWVMVVALPTEHKVRFYGSANLKSWKLMSEFGPQGLSKAPWECPFLIQLPVKNNLNMTRWVLMVSSGGPHGGPFMQYFVGSFDGENFKNDNPADSIFAVDKGDSFYAAIPWNNLAADKKIYIGWMVPGPQETYPWKGQMSIPRDLSLIQTSKGIRLIQQPTAFIKNKLKEISNNRMAEKKELRLKNQEIIIDKEHTIDGNAYWLEAELIVDRGATAGFKIGQNIDVSGKVISETEVGYIDQKNQVFVDRSNIGEARVNKDKVRQVIDLPNKSERIKLEILFDNSSLEVFVNNGEEVLTTYTFPAKDAHSLSFFAMNGGALIKKITIWDLSKTSGD